MEVKSVRTWLVLALAALALVLIWNRAEERPEGEPALDRRNPSGPDAARAVEHEPSIRIAERVDAGPSSAAPSALEELLALARSSPERMDFARGVVDWELMDQLRELVLRSGLDAAGFLELCRSMELDDAARPALVIALAWCPDPGGVAAAHLQQWIDLPGRRSNIEEQCALAAVRALGFSGRGKRLQSWVEDRLHPGAGLDIGLQSVRVWIALQELNEPPDAAATWLLGDERPDHLPERVQEELWALSVRSGDPTWSEEALLQAVDGSAPALSGVAALWAPDLQGDLLRLHGKVRGWARVAAQKGLLSMATADCRAAWLADVRDPGTRDGALEALRACSSPQSLRPDAVRELREGLSEDLEGLAILEDVLRRASLRRRVRQEQ